MIIFIFLVYSPPILEGFSHGSLMECIENPDLAKQYLDFPSHTQQVERAIKDLAFVAQRHEKENRDSVLNIISESRQQMPRNRTKKDYNIFKPNDEMNVLDLDTDTDTDSDTDTDDEIDWTDGFDNFE